MRDGAGQVIQITQAELNKWIQNWKQRSSTLNVIDGCCMVDEKSGLDQR